MQNEISKMNEIFYQISKKKTPKKVEPRRKPPDLDQLRYRKQTSPLKADEYLDIVNGSFGECLHELSPFSYVQQKRAGNEPKNWKCGYLKRYIDRNIDFA